MYTKWKTKLKKPNSSAITFSSPSRQEWEKEITETDGKHRLWRGDLYCRDLLYGDPYKDSFILSISQPTLFKCMHRTLSSFKNLNFSLIFREVYDYQESLMIHQLTKLLLTVMLIFTTESFRCNLTVCVIEHLKLFLVWAFSISTKLGFTTFLVRLQTFQWQLYWFKPIALIAYVGPIFIFILYY